MKTPLFKYLFYFFAASTFIGCSSDDDIDGPTPEEKDKFILMTTTSRFDAGFITPLSGFPSGSIQNNNTKTLQVVSAFGFRTFKNWLFNRSNAAGDVGLQKYTVNADGSLKDEGFIAGSSQYLVVNETSGYYLDVTRGTLKLQKFNPTTMLRTGEVDLSVVKKDGVEYQAVGQHTIAAKEGKLFVGITYGTKKDGGYGDDVFNAVEFAVVDLATDKYEKTIKYDGLKSIGWGSSGNKMWSIGDDGALYLYSTGLGNSAFSNPSIIRIKKGETDFDKTWVFSTKALKAGNSIATALVKGGKLYFEMATVPLKTDYSNLTASIFEYYTYDMTSKQITKIEGMPLHDYAYANEQAITEIDGKVYLWVRNGTVTTSGTTTVTTVNEDGYYVVDGNKATSVFKVAHDGSIQGFAKLSE
ncbi:hypothetical protein [Dyadobacter chenhuakuii]|uniref:DUF4374 domain-containing protein n=1 Tax=Dyadobacter chenhuakuii TaxID=2909339 RepID=A0ABY4XQC5_9BACT|nr:hypothetical protein [Dyadobacter chenhuakuii]MCF2493081.1 hypothetical protein [Dyadobacter chenhuakuii]USJ32632.1 hypothetical protein NFI80_07770 [Dyadobacter chenhuakuii]